MAVLLNRVYSSWAGWVSSTSYSVDSARRVQETNYKTLFIRGSRRVKLIIVLTNIVSRLGVGMCLLLPDSSCVAMLWMTDQLIAVLLNRVYSSWAGWVSSTSYSVDSARRVQETNYKTLFIRGSRRVKLIIVLTKIVSTGGGDVPPASWFHLCCYVMNDRSAHYWGPCSHVWEKMSRVLLKHEG